METIYVKESTIGGIMMKCDICERSHDIESLADIFGKKVCKRCLDSIASAEIGSPIYDYYVEALKNKAEPLTIYIWNGTLII